MKLECGDAGEIVCFDDKMTDRIVELFTGPREKWTEVAKAFKSKIPAGKMSIFDLIQSFVGGGHVHVPRGSAYRLNDPWHTSIRFTVFEALATFDGLFRTAALAQEKFLRVNPKAALKILENFAGNDIINGWLDNMSMGHMLLLTSCVTREVDISSAFHTQILPALERSSEVNGTSYKEAILEGKMARFILGIWSDTRKLSWTKFIRSLIESFPCDIPVGMTENELVEVFWYVDCGILFSHMNEMCSRPECRGKVQRACMSSCQDTISSEKNTPGFWMLGKPGIREGKGVSILRYLYENREWIPDFFDWAIDVFECGTCFDYDGGLGLYCDCSHGDEYSGGRLIHEWLKRDVLSSQGMKPAKR
jgi:hypothetical protein